MIVELISCVILGDKRSSTGRNETTDRRRAKEIKRGKEYERRGTKKS